MTAVLLIYPYFKPRHDRSVFRFPPLGVSYIAAALQQAGHRVQLLDCTFLERQKALDVALNAKVTVIGVYCMVSMREDCLWFAQQLRDHCRLLVVGGPLATCDPYPFLDIFDVVVRGEGEQTMPELLEAYETGVDLNTVAGIVFRSKQDNADSGPDLTGTPHRGRSPKTWIVSLFQPVSCYQTRITSNMGRGSTVTPLQR